MKNRCEGRYQPNNKPYQHQMNRWWSPQGYITAELYQRLCAQGIMEKIHRKVTGVRGSIFHIKKKPRMDYAPSIFTMPTTLGFSTGFMK